MLKVIEFLRNRARFYHCPACGSNFKGCGIQMLQAVEDRFTMQVTCPNCSLQFILVLSVQDTTPDQQEESSFLPPIESDEVLDLHLLLKDFNGQLTDLLLPPPCEEGAGRGSS